MVVGADGTGLTNLTHNGRFNGYPAWSKDRAWIAFVSGGCQTPMVPCLDTNHEVYLMRKDGSASPGRGGHRPPKGSFGNKAWCRR